jgi:predicted ferric reductase
VTELHASARLAGLTSRPATAPVCANRAAVAGAAWLVLAGNTAVIVWLWLHGGGISDVHSVGDGFTSVGRITGLMGAYSALIQVVLLARIPWIERLIGFDRLSVWHRRSGHACLYLVLAHLAAIVIGYAALDRISLPGELKRMTTSYPGMIAAWISTALLIAVVVSSVVIVRRRLRYEAWYAVHLAAYAGIALAWFHQIPTGNELVLDTVAADYWRALYDRDSRADRRVPRRRPLPERLPLPAPRGRGRGRRAGCDLAPDHGPAAGAPPRPGRAVLPLALPARDRWWTAHPFSLSEAPDGRSLRITVKALGNHTARLRSIKLGTRVVAEGPFGVFTAAAQRPDKVLLIAGGIGITPIRALLEEIHGDRPR